MTHIHTETYGKGKPIVLVHGWSMHSGIWRSFAKELAKNHRVTLVDLPGHGRSETISPFTLETVSDQLVNVLPNEACCWLGWSLGATVVVDITKRLPERVSHLILLAGSPCFVKKDFWPGMDERVLENFAMLLQQDSQATLLRFLSLQIKGVADPKSALQKIRPLVFECPSPDPETLQAGLAILKQTDLRDAFVQLKQPVSVILGQLDTLVPVAVGEKMQNLLPSMELTVIDRAGHVPFLFHSEQLVKTITAFLLNR